MMEEAGHSKSTFYMARQPIYDENLHLHAYELLYRSGQSGVAGPLSPEEELHALANVLVEVGLDRLAGSTLAYINVPSTLLASDALRLLPSGRVVLEVLEDTPWNDEVERNLRDLKAEGYRLALDDYIFEERHDPFLEIVEIVKVDVMGISPDKLKAGKAKLTRWGQKYLAEKVETPDEFRACQKMGFDFFQGYFFSKPATVRGSGVPANQGLSMSLLSKLQDPEITIDELERLLVANVALCHKVLRLVNSAAMGLTREVDSIRQAIMFLGTARIRTLASLAVMTAVPGKPPELYELAMVRARYCEAIAKESRFDSPEKHFTVGLLSVLDALTDLPMDEVIQELPLCTEVSEALCGTSLNTPCSRTLRHTLSVERGDWIGAETNLPGVPTHLYLDSVVWAEEQHRQMAA